jgi:alkylation response protein AidB-like acyl-CoA dehydrogenase
MRFHLSEEQLAIQASIRGTLADTLPSKKLHELVDGEEVLDRASWDALVALGLIALNLPEDQGGLGLGLLDAALAVEVLGEGAASGPFIPHFMTTLALFRSSHHDDLAALASGETIATVAFNGEWLPETWTLSVENGTVSGVVDYVPAAQVAGLFLVGLAGGTLGLVRAGDGVTIDARPSTDRTRRHACVTFENAPVTRLDTDVAAVIDAGLILTAADALGGAQKALDMSVEYAKVREQFGQPIGRFQALKHQLATMALDVEPARALVWYAAYAFDTGLPDARRLAAIAKAHLADRYVAVIRAAVAAHGGIGYTWEYDLSIWTRRSFFNRAFLGSPSTHRARAATLANW